MPRRLSGVFPGDIGQCQVGFPIDIVHFRSAAVTWNPPRGFAQKVLIFGDLLCKLTFCTKIQTDAKLEQNLDNRAQIVAEHLAQNLVHLLLMR